MDSLLIVDLGLLSWSDAYALQQHLVAARKAGELDDVFLLCEHPHVITLGGNANRANLLASERVLHQKGVALQATNRGGDITYHGPGQIVGYPVLCSKGTTFSAFAGRTSNHACASFFVASPL